MKKFLLLTALLLASCVGRHVVKSVTTKDHFNKRGKLESRITTTIYKN